MKFITREPLMVAVGFACAAIAGIALGVAVQMEDLVNGDWKQYGRLGAFLDLVYLEQDEATENGNHALAASYDSTTSALVNNSSGTAIDANDHAWYRNAALGVSAVSGAASVGLIVGRKG